jgi:hypothetical protein
MTIFLGRGNFFLLGIAVAAVNRASFAGFEGNLGFYTAGSAGYRMHLSGSAGGLSSPASAALRAALGTTAGVVLETVRGIKFLLSNCKDELLSAITTAKGLLF